ALVCMSVKAQHVPVPSIFIPTSIERNGRQELVLKDSIPFSIQFLDGNNIVWKEMRDTYYIMHHCSYSFKKNKVEINFLNNAKPALNYEVEYHNGTTLILKDAKEKITLEREKIN
ncbi:MAG: hypothetical protein JWN76_708, partial [Chitinophagaceae bacterium]|nr:hypothetical protein [Chitinophagaceae bacterium]